MKKLFITSFVPLFVLGCATSCNNGPKYFSIQEAKEIASMELDALEPEDYTYCELLDLGFDNKVYRVGGSDGEIAYLDILFDAVTGDVIQCESESLRCGNYAGFEDEHLTLEEVKQIIYEQFPGTSNFNIYSCYFEIDDDEDDKPLYCSTVFTLEGIHDLIIDAVTGEIIEDYYKDAGVLDEIDEFNSEFAEYLPQNRFADSNGKRPVWLLAHHCNDDYYASGRIKPDKNRDVYKGIKSGCNGVEIDLSHRALDDKIIVRHWPEVVSCAETLVQFLQLPELNNQQLTMVLYDIKDYKWIGDIVNDTHNFYRNNPDSQNVKFIYSINKLSKLKVKGYDDPYKLFRDIAPKLWPNEALAIDYENNQEQVRVMFDDIKFTRGVFGNGIFSGRARGNIEKSCKAAVALRDKTGPGEDPYRFKAVESWTVGRLKNKNWGFYESVGLEERINWGCDIVLLDGFKSLTESTFNSFYGRELFKVNQNVRLATRDDYPFGIKPEIVEK